MYKKRKFVGKKKFYPKKKQPYSTSYKKAVGRFKEPENRITFLGRKNWNLPFGASYVTKVTTCNQWYITSGAGSLPLTFEVKANSVYLPWNTTNPLPAGQVTYATATLKPLGTPTLLSTTMYASFRVFRSDIEIQCIPEPQGNDSINVSLFPAETGAFALDANTSQGRPFGKTYIQSGQTAIKKIRNSISIPTLAGVSAETIKLDGSSSYRGGVANDPVYLYKWYIYCWDSASNALTGANGSTVNFTAKVDYYVEFFNFQNDLIS